MKRLAALAAVALAGAVLGAVTMFAVEHGRGSSGGADPNVSAGQTASVTPRPGTATTASSMSGLSDFAALYAAVRPSIVEIDTSAQSGRRFRQVQGQGSGIVLDMNGNILTNQHVVDGALSITITFADGTTAPASIVGTNAANDLAIVKANASRSTLHPAKLGDSSALKVGNVVVAVGNPFGLEGSFTMGVISGFDRTLQGGDGQPDQQGLLQTDAAINEGSSGGGLFDLEGELVGITSALENPDGSTFAGVAYAVPINTAKQVMKQLLGG